MVERAGFEPAYPKSQIYSLVPLTTRPPLHSEEPAIMQEITVVVKRAQATFEARNDGSSWAPFVTDAPLNRAAKRKLYPLDMKPNLVFGQLPSGD
jgi:hypothetical protein